MSTPANGRQMMFNEVWAYAAKMTKPSTITDYKDDDGNPVPEGYDEEQNVGKCFYRLPTDGTPCFMGALIPDEIYDPKMDSGRGGKPISTLLTEFPKLAQNWAQRGFPGHEDREFMMALQYIHDFEFQNRMEQLKKFAVNHQLIVPDEPVS